MLEERLFQSRDCLFRSIWKNGSLMFHEVTTAVSMQASHMRNIFHERILFAFGINTVAHVRVIKEIPIISAITA